MATVFEKISIVVFLFLLVLLFGVSACEPPFPTQNKADLPIDHTEKKSYAYHKQGLYIPQKNCVECHGDTSLKGGISSVKIAAPGCRQCHPDIWTGVIEHTLELKGVDGLGYHKQGLYTPEKNCIQCHGQDLTGGAFNGSTTPSCTQCHGPMWDWRKIHTLLLKGPDGMGYHNPTDLHNPQVYCTQCHGKNLKGGTFNGTPTKSCYQCHKTAVWDWKSSHTVKLTGVDGTGYHQTGYNTPLTNCVTCHGTDLKGGTSKRSCYQCHKTAVWDWKSIHTVNIGGHLHKPGFFTPTTNCTQCHGTDLKGGTSGRSCYTSTCHATAVWDWKSTHTRRRDGVMHMSGNNSTCTKCHGTDFTGGISKRSCYSTGCHRSGRPPG